jgi:ribosomal protein S18 acetylase RimI-like enzyme
MHINSWRETYAGILPDATLAALSVEKRMAMWDEILREPESLGSTVVHLAEINGQLAGFGSCGSQRTKDLAIKGFSGEISALYVLRPFQGRGIGARLFRTMSSNLVNRAFKAASLWVLNENSVARRFYAQQGGRVVGEREDLRGDTVLTEIAYGWADLTELIQPVHKQHSQK